MSEDVAYGDRLLSRPRRPQVRRLPTGRGWRRAAARPRRPRRPARPAGSRSSPRSVSSSAPGNDSPAMKIETVKPMPPTAPRPTSIGQRGALGQPAEPEAYGQERRQRRCRPACRGPGPATMPSADRLGEAPCRSPPSSTPALASAKTGSTTYAETGCSALTAAARPPSTDSLSRNRSRASSSGSRCVVAQRLAGVAARDLLLEQRGRRARAGRSRRRPGWRARPTRAARTTTPTPRTT